MITVRVRTDDEVYRVDAVWLGPPKATLPWRARYVAWGVGMVVFLVTLTIERRIGFGFSFFVVAWAMIITVGVTRIICSRISHERPLGAVLVMWLRELNTPRLRATGNGGAVSATRVRIANERPRPGLRPERASRQRGKRPVQRQPRQNRQRGQATRQPRAAVEPGARQLPAPRAGRNQRRQLPTGTPDIGIHPTGSARPTDSREVRGVRTPVRK